MNITVGGNKITYDGPFSTPIVDLTTAKLHCNSFISTPDSKYHIVDVKNLYLKNLMKNNEYYKIAINLTPQVIIYKYDLNNKKIDSYIYYRF